MRGYINEGVYNIYTFYYIMRLKGSAQWSIDITPADLTNETICPVYHTAQGKAACPSFKKYIQHIGPPPWGHRILSTSFAQRFWCTVVITIVSRWPSHPNWYTLWRLHRAWVLVAPHTILKTSRQFALQRSEYSLRGMPLPYDPEDKCNDSTIAIANLADEETAVLQREPVTEAIAAEAISIRQQADQDSVDSLVANIICLSRFFGTRLSERAQNTRRRLLITPGDQVTKLFTL